MARTITDILKSAGERYSIDTADVAILIRQQLKAKFPGCKFSVRIERYSGGSSIDIRWVDGPTAAAVNEVARQYKGKGFDGMIDMEYGYDHWLLPDGSAVVRSTHGTEGSMGVVPAYSAEKPHPDAVAVRFGSGYVSVERRYSREFLEAAAAEGAKKYGIKPEQYSIRGEEPYCFIHAEDNDYRTQENLRMTAANRAA